MPGAAHFAKAASESGACLGIEQSADGAHPVCLLLADGEEAAPRPLGIRRCGPVLVEHIGEPTGGRAQFGGTHFGSQPAQIFFGFFASLIVDGVGQVREEVANHLDVLDADFPVSLTGRNSRQQRLEEFTRKRVALAEVSGLADAPLRLSLGDAQPHGQRLGERGGAKRFGSTLGAQLVDQRMFYGRQATAVGLQSGQESLLLGGGQHVAGHRGDRLERFVEVVVRRFDVFPTRTHASNISSKHRQVEPVV